jgi:hypothetical protein
MSIDLRRDSQGFSTMCFATLSKQMSKWFYDTSTGAATGAARCDSFVGKTFSLLVVSSSERSGLGNLRGSGRLSVIPYVHRRTELSCAQACLA